MRSLSKRAALGTLALLLAVNLLNYVDRYVLASVMPQIRQSGIHLSDFELGTLMTGFLVVYVLTAPLFGALGDRGRRNRLIAFGITLWSLATAATGLAQGYAQLFLTRAAVGIGEAAYGTIAPALLADCFDVRYRARVLSVFYMATPVGIAMGYVYGGLAAQAWGWRNAFVVAGIPGLLLAALVLKRVPDPPRGAQDRQVPEPATTPPAIATSAPAATPAGAPGPGITGTLKLYLALLRIRTYLLGVLGYGAYTFALGGTAFWMPTFLQRVKGLTQAQASTASGVVLMVTGLVGTMAGGWLGDALQRRSPRGCLWLAGVATIVAVPLLTVALVAPQLYIYYPALVLAQLTMFLATGPVNSAIISVVSPVQRASAVALFNLAYHILGDMFSPTVIGAVSDRHSLGTAMLVCPVAITLAGVLWIGAARAKA